MNINFMSLPVVLPVLFCLLAHCLFLCWPWLLH